MKKYLLLGFLTLCFVNTNVNAKEIVKLENNLEISKNNLCDSTKDYGNIIFRNDDFIDGKKVQYYCEFENDQEALNNIKEKYKETFSFLQKKYNLEELSTNNWNAYYESASKDNNTDNYLNYQQIRVFFDTYENKFKNNQIEELIGSLMKSKNSSVNKKNILKTLDTMLPSYNMKLSEEEYSIMPLADQKFNVTAGVNYAKNYAWNANKSKYGELGADCTNFASQILENGGYTQVWGLTNRFGWWYKNDNGNFKYSWSWVNADSFLKYWGIKNYYYDFEQLSRNVQVGDFIILDENDDGDYNHTGFVTYKSNSLSSHTIANNVKLNYYDFIVAQHTNNYNSWVSEDVNGWENGVLTNSRYAIVNINK